MDSSLSSVPPEWARPRPDISPNGTPHAATIGPTAIEVLFLDSAGRVLVDHPAAQGGAEVDRVAGADHRVGERVRLAPVSPF